MTPPDKTSEMEAHEAHLQETVALAEERLREVKGRGVRLSLEKSFRGEGSRATVVRCAVEGGRDEPGRRRDERGLGRDELGQGTVIVKRFLEDGGAVYRADDESGMSGRGRMLARLKLPP